MVGWLLSSLVAVGGGHVMVTAGVLSSTGVIVPIGIIAVDDAGGGVDIIHGTDVESVSSVYMTGGVLTESPVLPFAVMSQLLAFGSV